MKIHQMPMGARFEYQGEEYVKSGPMVATGKAGQRMIPKYAVLKPLGEVEPERAVEAGAALPRGEVLRAFDAFYARCAVLVPAAQRDELALGRTAFLAALSDLRV